MNEQNRDSALQQAEALAGDILQMARNNLVVHLRFLDAALSRLRLESDPTGGWSVDGVHLRYSALQVLRAYREELHMVFHCVFHHAFSIQLVDRTYWDLACDIAVESVIADLKLPALTTARQRRQAEYLETLQKQVQTVTAERVYRYLQDSKVGPDELERLNALFHADSHDCWYAESDRKGDSDRESPDDEDDAPDSPSGEGNGRQRDNRDGRDQQEDGKGGPGQGAVGDAQDGKGGQQNQRRGGGQRARQRRMQWGGAGRADVAEDWKGVAQRMEMDLQTFQQGNLPDNVLQNIKAVTREKYDYASFLRKFAVMGEVMHINDQEFDYIFYTFGLQHYGKMPLIEPLEYREEKRVREMVIAIDTSGSVQGELVQQFLQKTYNILKQAQNFFNRINIHIIQCDAAVQEDRKITSQEDLDLYMREMQFHGFGGTDFRPVFRLVEEHRRSGEIQNLKGLIYFTDGYGTFPERPPDYPAAFVFVGDQDDVPDVPPWAIRLLLRPEELRED